MLLQYYLTRLHLFPSRVLHLSLVEQFYALLHLFFGRFLDGCTDGVISTFAKTEKVTIAVRQKVMGLVRSAP